MQGITRKNVTLLSRSGLVLLILSMLGSFALATFRTTGSLGEETWSELFNLLFIAVLGIATYYLALSFFSWSLLKGKQPNGP
jgi:Ca2+/H+ antiporter